VQQNDKKIQVILLDEHTLFRTGLRLILERQPDIQVVGEAGSLPEALSVITKERADIVLLETNLIGKPGVEIISDLLFACGPAKIILLTSMCDTQNHISAVQAGVVGVILKNQTEDMLLKAIRKVHHGEVWIDRAMMANLVHKISQTNNHKNADPEAKRIEQLSQREREVLSLIGKGLKNRDIAAELNISETTVSHHLTSIFNKLGVSDRLELVIYAYRYGLAQPPC
jgi:DNA-binding NarL/FixJ family response regulator